MTTLIIILVILIFISGFFASSETAMMAINRYRLRYKARQGNNAAKRVQKLLKKPDRLIGTILIGNTFSNILASSIATVITIHYFGASGVAIAAIFLTLILLIFAEIAPKTLAIIYSQKMAFLFSLPLLLLLRILYPIVFASNLVANGLLRLFKIKVPSEHKTEYLTEEELRVLVGEVSHNLPLQDKSILLSALDLNNIKVEDIMVIKNEIPTINLQDNWDDIKNIIINTRQTHLPICDGSRENIKGILQLRDVLNAIVHNKLDKAYLQKIMLQPYFVPENTSIGIQLFNFRNKKQYAAIIVDEYGEAIGFITLEDILEEIIGEFVVDIGTIRQEIHQQKDGSILVDGSISIRKLNKLTDWNLPIKGPKTLSGLIIEYLTEIPPPGVCMQISGYIIEIISVRNNMIRTAKIIEQKFEQRVEK